MNNSKKAVLGVALVGLLFVSSTHQTFAAENIFQRVQKSVSSKVDNLYLRFVPGKKSGKLVLKQMSESYKTLKSFESDTTLDAQVTGEGKTLATAKLNMVGVTKLDDVWNPQTYSQEVKVTGNVAFEGTTLSAIADMKMIDGVTYVMVSQLPALPGFPSENFKNTWIKVTPEKANEATSMVEPTAEQKQKMQDALMKLLESAQVSDAVSEKKDGENVFLLELTLSKPTLVEYFMTVTEVQKEIMVAAATTEEEKEMITRPSGIDEKANLQAALDYVGDLKMKLWVERSHYYPTYFEMPLTVDAKRVIQLNASPNPTLSNIEKANITITSDMRKFNEPVNVVAPEGAQDIQSLMGKMMGVPSDAAMVAPPAQIRKPTVGTSELPELTDWQKQQLDMYDNR